MKRITSCCSERFKAVAAWGDTEPPIYDGLNGFHARLLSHSQ